LFGKQKILSQSSTTASTSSTTSDNNSKTYVVVCGISYACTGDQSGINPDYNQPAYPGWEKEIESINGNEVVFVQTPNPSSDYSVLEYSKKVEGVIASSSSGEIVLICHSRGGQTCADVAHLGDPRITHIILIEPSVRDGGTDNVEPFDSIGDYNNLFSANNSFETSLIVGNQTDYTLPSGGIGVPSASFTNYTHNGLVYNQEVLQYILSTTASK
jgi:pimeloyl-ACP methyl ester carboxylesterase